jgi:hypothetical protein
MTTLLPSAVTVIQYTAKAALIGTRFGSTSSTPIEIVLRPTSPPATSYATVPEVKESNLGYVLKLKENSQRGSCIVTCRVHDNIISRLPTLLASDHRHHQHCLQILE